MSGPDAWLGIVILLAFGLYLWWKVNELERTVMRLESKAEWLRMELSGHDMQVAGERAIADRLREHLLDIDSTHMEAVLRKAKAAVNRPLDDDFDRQEAR